MGITRLNSNELNVFLGDLCNMDCSHCYTSSSPKAKKYKITQDEIDNICSFILNNPSYKLIHFIGGEPTLFIEQIKSITSRLPNIYFAITTNGWFSNSNITLLDNLNISQINISYDKFHKSKLTSLDSVLNLVHHFKNQNKKVSINFVYEKLIDFSYIQEFTKLGIPINGRKVGKGGKQKDTQNSEFKENNPTDNLCYMFENASTEQALFMPQKGLIPCCGPLNFDNLADPEDYSANCRNYEDNRLSKVLKNKKISEIMHEIGYSTNKVYNDRCEACVDILGKTQAGPSIYKILTSANKKKIEIHDILDNFQNDSISTNNKISYTFEGKNLLNLFPHKLDNNINFKEITDIGELNNALKLAKDTMIQNYPTFFESTEFEKGENLVKNLYQSSKILGCNYYYKEIHVGALMFSHLHHPLLLDNVLHILFFGYNKKHLNIDQSKSIKNLVLNLLISNQNEKKITARIDGFNEKSIRFFKSIGMTPKYLTLDQKEL